MNKILWKLLMPGTVMLAMPFSQAANLIQQQKNNYVDTDMMVKQKYRGFIKYINFKNEKNYQAQLFLHWTLLQLLLKWQKNLIYDEKNVEHLITEVFEKNIFNFAYYNKKIFMQNVATNIVKTIGQNNLIMQWMFNVFINHHGAYLNILVSHKQAILRLEAWNNQFKY